MPIISTLANNNTYVNVGLIPNTIGNARVIPFGSVQNVIFNSDGQSQSNFTCYQQNNTTAYVSYQTNYAVVSQTSSSGNLQLGISQYSSGSWSTPTYSNINFQSNPPNCLPSFQIESQTVTIQVGTETVSVDISGATLTPSLSLFSNTSTASNLVPATQNDISNGSFYWFDTSTQSLTFTGTTGSGTNISGTITITPIMPTTNVLLINTNSPSTPGALAEYLPNYQSLLNGVGLSFAIVSITNAS